MKIILMGIYEGIIEGDIGAVQQMVADALEKRIDPSVILNDGLIAAMGEVGRKFEIGEFYVPEMLVAARAMQAGMMLLKPRLIQDKIKSTGKVVIGTVKGDLHDIGKNLVSMMLEGAGFDIKDLGTDISPEQFVNSVRDGDVNILAMSALLTTTMLNMRTTIEALEDAGLRDTIKVMIGGAPVTEAYAMQIGADGYAPDASRAVGLAKLFVAG
jgi:5-methyltetrahydrofolate--homocysteine methyltransferase